MIKVTILAVLFTLLFSCKEEGGDENLDLADAYGVYSRCDQTDNNNENSKK